MQCPKCNKNIPVNKSNIQEQDGGVNIIIECNSCKGTFECFIIPDDFEEIYDIEE